MRKLYNNKEKGTEAMHLQLLPYLVTKHEHHKLERKTLFFSLNFLTFFCVWVLTLFYSVS